ncbi:MAG: transcription elongation factor GreA [Pseudomonadota bacterium]
METVPITQVGFRKLKEQLRQLEQVEWPDILKDIEEARAHGDLSENAEYQYAKEKQGRLDAKIRQLKDRLSRADVIDPSKMSGDQVLFGATAVAKNLEAEKEVTYILVGPDEADVTSGKISILSPIGRAFVGKKVGDMVEVKTPGGMRTFEILKIKWD